MTTSHSSSEIWESFSLEALPAFDPHEWDTLVAQIAVYFRRLVDGRNSACASCEGVELPSVSQLAEYMTVSELDILEAFHDLKREGYIYQIHGLHQPVRLSDPLRRLPDVEAPLKKLTQFVHRQWQGLRSQDELSVKGGRLSWG